MRDNPFILFVMIFSAVILIQTNELNQTMMIKFIKVHTILKYNKCTSNIEVIIEIHMHITRLYTYLSYN